MSSPFQAALEDRDLAGLRACPKADLHVHAGFPSGDRQFLKTATGLDIEPLNQALASMDDMHAWVQNQAGDGFHRMPGRLLGIQATFVQARRDGVTRLEAGEDVWGITLHGGSAPAVWAMLETAHARGAPEIDRRAKSAGLRLKAHVGEWGTADDVWQAVELLELDEVQHGIAAASSPAAMRFLARAGVRLNVCPTSNVMLGRVARIKEHPIRQLFDAGVRVTIGTDDPLIFGTSLSREFLALANAGVLTPSELDAVRLAALA